MDKKKKIIIVIAIVCSLLLGFFIYWTATEDSRYLKNKMKEISEDIAENRAENDNFFYFFHFFISDETANNTAFQDFLIEQVQEMYQNKEYKMLRSFLGCLEKNDVYCERLLETVNNCFQASGDIEEALSVFLDLSYRDYYNVNMGLNRNSPLIAAYIDANGTNNISTTEGEGYYANEKNTYEKEIIGLPNSPLYDARKVIFFGDYKIEQEYGVELNAFYEETNYSRETYFFRNNAIKFLFEDNIHFLYDEGSKKMIMNNADAVWSGDYWFCFDSAGNLIAYCKL